MMRPRKRADVGAAVPAHLGFVGHAAERDANERSARGTRDRSAERCLADARRANEAQNWRSPVAPKLAHRDVLDDPALWLVEPVVVFVQHSARLHHVEPVGVCLRPWKVGQPLHIGSRHLVLAARRVHVAHAAQLALRSGRGLARQAAQRDSLAEVLDFVLVDVGFPELSADGLDLLSEQVLAL